MIFGFISKWSDMDENTHLGVMPLDLLLASLRHSLMPSYSSYEIPSLSCVVELRSDVQETMACSKKVIDAPYTNGGHDTLRYLKAKPHILAVMKIVVVTLPSKINVTLGSEAPNLNSATQWGQNIISRGSFPNVEGSCCYEG